MKVLDRAEMELLTPGSAVQHMTDCALEPGKVFVTISYKVL